MKVIAKMFPARAWLSVAVYGWALPVVVVRCGLVDETRRYYNISIRDAVKRFRDEFSLNGIRLRRVVNPE